MKQAYLLGHTGSINRGCEAIVRSTADVLEKTSFSKINLIVYNDTYDRKVNLNESVDIKRYKKRNVFIKAFTNAFWRYFKVLSPFVLVAKNDLKFIDKKDTVFTIGGDTYCYAYPYRLVAQNIATHKLGLKNVFWGCSVDERVLSNKKLIDDINRYSYIITRESLSYNILKQIVKDENKLCLACDPAFNLKIKQVELPEGFIEQKTVGINLSPAFFKDYKDKNDLMRENVRSLIDFILTEMNMNVCLIPHVYDAELNLQDIAVLREVKSEYSSDARVLVVEQNLSCEQLKYIISKCRFFVGARTHSMIAAYSTAVPALALSYSIKSRGIAKDLYGDEELVVQYKTIQETDKIKVAFKRLVEREEEIKKIYFDKLAAYKQSIFDVCEKMNF